MSHVNIPIDDNCCLVLPQTLPDNEIVTQRAFNPDEITRIFYSKTMDIVSSSELQSNLNSVIERWQRLSGFNVIDTNYIVMGLYHETPHRLKHNEILEFLQANNISAYNYGWCLGQDLEIYKRYFQAVRSIENVKLQNAYLYIKANVEWVSDLSHNSILIFNLPTKPLSHELSGITGLEYALLVHILNTRTSKLPIAIVY